MKTMKGPGIFLAQFAGDAAPFNSLDSIAAWVASQGYKGIQIPSWDKRLFDLDRAAMEAVRRWTFRPATRNGQPVTATVIVPLEFNPGG